MLPDTSVGTDRPDCMGWGGAAVKGSRDLWTAARWARDSFARSGANIGAGSRRRRGLGYRDGIAASGGSVGRSGSLSSRSAWVRHPRLAAGTICAGRRFPRVRTTARARQMALVLGRHHRSPPQGCMGIAGSCSRDQDSKISRLPARPLSSRLFAAGFEVVGGRQRGPADVRCGLPPRDCASVVGGRGLHGPDGARM